MDRHQWIIEELPEVLEQLAKREVEVQQSPNGAQGADVILRLGFQLLVIEAKTSSRVSMVAQAAEQARAMAARLGKNAVPVVAVPFMGPSGREVCEDEGVGFVDLSGNAHLEAPGLLIHVEGRPNRFVSRGRPSSVFAPKSSRIARALLHDPSRWWAQSELAAHTDLGRGYVSRITRRMDNEGLIVRNEGKALRPKDAGFLLDAWRSEYSFDDHEICAGHVPSRSGPELLRQLVEFAERETVKYAVTGLAAAALWAPFANYRLVAMYVLRRPTQEWLRELSFRQGKRGANTWLAFPNDESVFADDEQIEGINCVSKVQAYLDLKDMPERSDEAAEHLRRRCLTWA